MTEHEARALGRDLARSMARYLWAWSVALLVLGVGVGIFFGGAATVQVGVTVMVVGGLKLSVTTFAWRRFLRGKPQAETEEADSRSSEEKLGAKVCADATGDCPVSFVLSEQGRAELNRAAMRLGVSHERAVAIAMGDFLQRYGRVVKS